MDDAVLAQFQSALGEVHDSARSHHPHYTLYKAKGDGSYANQEARRKAFLLEQQNRRRNYADLARMIAEGEEISDEEDEMEEGAYDEVDMPEAMETTKKASKKKKKKYPYKNQLMLSEWLVEVPVDFEENWLAVVVPVGRRSLVVAARKTTCAFSRAGDMLRDFPSLLPGGSKRTHRLARDYCILDCVFYEGTRTYYIIDVMCWGGHPVYDSDFEFRTFWKEQKCKESAEISSCSRINPLPFQNLSYHACTKENLARLLAEDPPYEVDGLLFIHKQCRYIIGHTPLAVWLKPHMIPDILGIPVSAEFLAKSPDLSARKEKMDTGAKKSPKGTKTKMETDGKSHGAANPQVSMDQDLASDGATNCGEETVRAGEETVQASKGSSGMET